MKALFEVAVKRGDERAAEALRNAGLWVMGPPYNQSGDVIIQFVFVVVEADGPDAASVRVQEALPNRHYVVQYVTRLEDK
jgi:hypothetical protein